MTIRTPAIIGQEFAFAHGRTGVLQQWLLGRQDVDRLLGAHSAKEAEQILTELKFTKQIDQGLKDPTAILHACNAWIRKEVADMCPEHKQAVFNILWLNADEPLLSYLIKESKGLTSDISRRPSAPFSAYDDEALSALVFDGVEGTLPKDVVAFVQRMQDSDVRDPREIDTMVSAFFAAKKLEIAQKSGSKAITTYVRHTIDIHNIRTIVRFNQEERAEAAAYLLSGGTVKVAALTGSNTHTASVLRQAGLYSIADALDTESVESASLEQLFSNLLAEDISRMWNTILRVEPAFAFAATALSQLALLRVILMGKRNKLGPQEIKRVLPPFLSASHYNL